MNPFERWDEWEWERAAQEMGRDQSYNGRDYPGSRRTFSKQRSSSKDLLAVFNGSQKRVVLSALLLMTVIFSAKGEDVVSRQVYSVYRGGLESGNLYTAINTMAKEAMGIAGDNSMAVNTQVKPIFYPPVAGVLQVGFGGKNALGEVSQGIEIGSALGKPVLCPEEGVVLEVGEDKRLGRFIRFNFGNGWEGIIGNLGEVVVKKGDPVAMGVKVGTVGLKGESDKPWLYLELLRDGQPVNPLLYLIQNK